ncbi:nucleolin 2-like isoform X2 [Cornus florida]|uniref:nucleolin 2-like isoform X2 n=1 Tax=Cornus florida TaxID=4283 RepID=UPI002896F0B1|nr:nucleolin 2-like isoform X2 [Cornus florida]
MPPKSKASTAVGPRRRPAVRKSAAITSSETPPSSTTTTTTTTTNTAAAATLEPSSSGKSETTFNSSPKTSTKYADNVSRTLPKTTPLTFPKTTSKIESEMGIAERTPNISEEASDQTAPIETVPEKASSTAPETAVANTMIENGGGIGQEDATKAPAKTVVKKTVRIVKKIVKRKVPKRVQTGLVVSSNEESAEKRGTGNDGENPKFGVLGSLEVESADPNQSVPVEVKNCNLDSNAFASKEVENPHFFDVAVDAENPNCNPSASMEVENPKEPGACNEEKDASLTEILSEACVSDSVETKNNINGTETAVSFIKTQLDDENVDLIQNENYECETKNIDFGGGECKEGEKEEVENCEVGDLRGEVGMANGVLLSGEMEALERKRRRKTEIFIGGLDKDTKEEDIRKVFEEVGEIVEVRVMMKGRKGKNGFAFVRFASAADAKNALAKYPKVEICGKQCGVAFVEGNDTIFLGNLDKKWKSEDVLKLLQEIGIEKIDKVAVMADPTNIECNRGFAFLELETKKDAQKAYKKLQNKDVFGKHGKIKVAWAEPLKEPDEEEMLKVKSVYAEYIPSLWDEERVRDHFKKFGEIENVALARNLRSSKRKDFAFVNYTTREAALACIEAFNHVSLNDDDSKVKVSLAKPIPKGKQIKQVSNPISKESSIVKRKAAQPVIKSHERRDKGKLFSSYHADVGVYRSSTNTELVQLLREQASWKQPRTGLGSRDLDYPCSSPGKKRPYTAVVDDPIHSDFRNHSRARFESSFPVASPSGLSQGVGMTSLPYYHRQGSGYATGSLYGVEDYPNSFLGRGAAPYLGSSGSYPRY